MCDLKLAADVLTVLCQSEISSCQSVLRAYARAPRAITTTAGNAHRAALPERANFSLTAHNDSAATVQNPIDGRYRNRSAMMLPIFRRRFDVGAIMPKRKRPPHANIFCRCRSHSAATMRLA